MANETNSFLQTVDRQLDDLAETFDYRPSDYEYIDKQVVLLKKMAALKNDKDKAEYIERVDKFIDIQIHGIPFSARFQTAIRQMKVARRRLENLINNPHGGDASGIEPALAQINEAIAKLEAIEVGHI